MKEKLKDRFNILIMLLVLMGLVILLQLVNLQVVNGERLEAESQRRFLNEREIPASRGKILDRNGVPIAVNRMGFYVQIVKTGQDKDTLNKMGLELIKLFELNGDSYYRSLSKYLTFNPIGFGPLLKNQKDPMARLETVFGLEKGSLKNMKTAGDVFRYLCSEAVYGIDDSYSDEEAYKIMAFRFEIRNYGRVTPVVLARDVSRKTVAEVEERHREFPGVTTGVEPLRKYIDASYVAHVLGFVGLIDEEEYKNLKGQYDMNDIIGKSGVERAAEKYLRGVDGKKRIETDIWGRLTQELDSIPAIPGDNIILTIDMNLQKVAAQSLDRTINGIRDREKGKYDSKSNLGDANAGAVVAMDVNNGEILAMASYPGYDPSIFLAGANNKEAQKAIAELYENEDMPEWNRAIAGTYPPGSTFKPLVGIAGLEEGVLTSKNHTLEDPGYYEVDGWRLFCLEYRHGILPRGHGHINLADALATSCNVFFYKLGVLLTGDKIDNWARMFGLGEKTGIDIGGEERGSRSNSEVKKKYEPNSAWGRLDTAMTAIGQRYNLFTPLQLCNYISTIGNGGKRYTPHLIKRRESYDGSQVYETPVEFEQIPVKKSTLEAVIEGMVKVASSSEGTAAKVFEEFTKKTGIRVAGKTGTAETPWSITGKHSNNGVFVCFAPAEKPEIAIAVIIERGVFGYYAANVALEIMEAYFDVNSGANQQSQDVLMPEEVVLIP